jgi:hypothetical protein
MRFVTLAKEVAVSSVHTQLKGQLYSLSRGALYKSCNRGETFYGRPWHCAAAG